MKADSVVCGLTLRSIQMTSAVSTTAGLIDFHVPSNTKYVLPETIFSANLLI